MSRHFESSCTLRLEDVGLDRLSQLAETLVEAASLSSQPDASSIASRCFGLVGTLGAGKTRLCQEIAVAFGLDPSDVTSPTFTLLRSYDVSKGPRSASGWLHHLDLYRIGDEDEFWELGLEELWEQPQSWTLIEWADRFAEWMPNPTIWVDISYSSPGDSGDLPTRTIQFSSHDQTQRTWLIAIGETLRSRWTSDHAWVQIES